MNKFLAFTAICIFIVIEVMLLLPMYLGITAIVFLEFNSFSMNPTGVQLNPVIWTIQLIVFIALGFAIIRLRKYLSKA